MTDALDQTLPYGAGTLRIAGADLPRGWTVTRLEAEPRRTGATAADVLRDCLERPVGSPRLREIARGKRTAAILIPGRDRVAGTREYVPALLAELNAGGIPDERIEVFVAAGTHAFDLEADVARLLGAETASRVRCRAHHCRDDAEVTRIGTTSRGTPVEINRHVLAADVKVLTGRIVPHYFAGTSGGRKALVPGVAGIRTITANHRLTLDPRAGIHPEVRAFSLERNPVHLDLVEAARLAAPDFSLNTLVDSRGEIVDAVAGCVFAAHEEGSRRAAETLRYEVERPLDGAITSAGGAPHDCNLMQGLKAVFDVQEAVRHGGAILWIAECPEGIHDGFLRWAAIERDDELDRAVRAGYTLTGHNSIMLRRLVRRCEVAMLTALPAEVLAKLGVRRVASLEEGLAWLAQRCPADARVAVVPRANALCATPREPVAAPLEAVVP